MSDYRFYHPVEVRYGDLDPQGHVNNAKHLTYFEQARVAYMINLGLFTKDQSFMKIGVIVADVHITYLAPVYFGQNIQVGVRTAKLGNKSMTWEQNVMDADAGKELSTGELVIVTYDYGTGKTISIPQEWREKISEFERLKV
jgi:acyl-CoA thioester hydrolase